MAIMSWIGYRIYYRPGALSEAARNAGDHGRTASGSYGRRGYRRKTNAVVEFLTRIGSNVPSSEAEIANLKTDLIRAGFRSEKALPVFYGIRIVCVLVMLAVSLVVQVHMPANPMMSVALLVFGCAAGWVFCHAFFLEKKVAKPAGDAAPFAARRAGPDGGLGGGGPRPGSGHPARGPRTAT